ncbi:hypothetical protein JCM15519_11640 [Fundidesulfovibrio butyratiphilus]
MRKLLLSASLAAFLAVGAAQGQCQDFRGQRYADPAPVPVAPGPGPDPRLHPQSPPPEPRPHKTPVMRYRYYPAVNIYLDPLTGLYWSAGPGGWALGPLPPGVPPHRLGRPVTIWGEEGRPWRRMDPR